MLRRLLSHLFSCPNPWAFGYKGINLLYLQRTIPSAGKENFIWLNIALYFPQFFFFFFFSFSPSGTRAGPQAHIHTAMEQGDCLLFLKVFINFTMDSLKNSQLKLNHFCLHIYLIWPCHGHAGSYFP